MSHQEREAVKIVSGYIPPSGNSLRRKYRDKFAYAKLREEWKHGLWYTVPFKKREYLLAMAAIKKRMKVTITITHKKLYDKDNAYAGCKPVLDALKALGFIWDDSPEAIELEVLQEKLNDIRTEIKIEACEGE